MKKSLSLKPVTAPFIGEDIAIRRWDRRKTALSGGELYIRDDEPEKERAAIIRWYRDQAENLLKDQTYQDVALDLADYLKYTYQPYLENKNKLCFLLSGEEKHIASMLKHIATIISAYHSLKDNKLGVIGGASSWLIASPIEPKVIYTNFKINVIKIKMSELDELIEETEGEMLDAKDIPHSNELINKYKDKEVIHQALVIYVALKKLVRKYELKGLTIRCFDLLKKYKNTACLALALLNEEGITAGCEGDIFALLTMHVVHALTGRSAFMANPSKFNYEDHSILLAHCTVPLNMTSSYSLDTHFESGLGIGVRGEMPEGRITLCKIAPDYTLDNCVCMPASIKDNPNLEGYCRTQITVSLDEDGLLELLKASFGNHLVVSYGDVYQDFFPLLSLLRR